MMCPVCVPARLLLPWPAAQPWLDRYRYRTRTGVQPPGGGELQQGGRLQALLLQASTSTVPLYRTVLVL